MIQASSSNLQFVQKWNRGQSRNFVRYFTTQFQLKSANLKSTLGGVKSSFYDIRSAIFFGYLQINLEWILD